MPVFSYICKKCGSVSDLLVGVTQEKTELKCSSCGSPEIRKTFSAFGVGKSRTGQATMDRGSCSSCPNGGSCPMM